ncbi:hypothetical protein CW735_13490 [Alteromonas sp. MB-3u-76]|nr:hypothetical protein CW735_13490 [Alteromonas sp. MB-3u-76]
MRLHDTVVMLISNAGVALSGDFEQVSETDFNWLKKIKFDAPVNLMLMITVGFIVREKLSDIFTQHIRLNLLKLLTSEL